MTTQPVGAPVSGAGPTYVQTQAATPQSPEVAAAWAKYYADQAAAQAPAAPLPYVPAGPPMLAIPGVTIATDKDFTAPMLSVCSKAKVGKCVAGSTLVLDPRIGRRVSIRDLVQTVKADGRALTMNAAGLLVPTKPVNFFENPAQQLFRLRTQTGYEIEATAGHEFLTQDGWKALSALDLKVDRVMTIAEYPWAVRGGTKPLDENWLKILAYLIADGYVDTANPVFTKNELVVRDDFIHAVEAFGDVAVEFESDTVKNVRVKANAGDQVAKVTEALRSSGLFGARAGDKFIPPQLFEAQKGQLALFLNRLFTCDGCVESRCKVSYSSKSRRLVGEVRHMLARFGIVATVRDKFIDGELYGAELLIGSRSNVIRFIDEIGFFGEKADRAQVVREKLARASDRADETQIWRHGSYIFDRIKSIEATSIEPTFDIEIETSHNYVANDFVVHNSRSVITSLVDWPTPGKHPLVIAVDDSGPLSCIDAGYYPHRVRLREEDYPGLSFEQAINLAITKLHQSKVALHQQYGSIVVDCGSTLADKLHTAAKKIPKNARNPNMQAPFFELGVWFRQVISLIRDLDLPNVWLSWSTDGFVEPANKELKTPAKTIPGGPDILGGKLRNYYSGQPAHNFYMEKRKVGTGSRDYDTGLVGDADGYVRVLHSKPYDNIDAGGRLQRFLPAVCPAHLGWVLSKITGLGPYADAGRR